MRLRRPDPFLGFLLVALVVLLALLGPCSDPDTVDVDAGAGNPVSGPSTSTSSTSPIVIIPVAPTTTSSAPVPEPGPAQRTAPTPPASVAAPRENGSAPGAARLRTTAYCLTGNMASGKPTYVGAVAANRYRIGTRVTAWPNPWGDPAMVFTVEDRHRDGATELDFAMPGECERALEWGNRKYADVRVVSEPGEV